MRCALWSRAGFYPMLQEILPKYGSYFNVIDTLCVERVFLYIKKTKNPISAILVFMQSHFFFFFFYFGRSWWNVAKLGSQCSHVKDRGEVIERNPHHQSGAQRLEKYGLYRVLNVSRCVFIPTLWTHRISCCAVFIHECFFSCHHCQINLHVFSFQQTAHLQHFPQFGATTKTPGM